MACPKLSIIIPFYNVEQYIALCLDSVFEQDIPDTDYEVICVNDASPDNSRDIVLQYMNVHKNLFLIEHKENRKLGSARNTGRSIARGKYLWNVDSDDKIAPNSLQTILKLCESNDLDVLMFNHSFIIDGVLTENSKYPFVSNQVMSGLDFLDKEGLDNFSEISPVWNQIFRREFLDQNNIYSPPINMGEDVPYTFKSLIMSKKIMTVTNVFYQYRINKQSLGGQIESTPNPYKLFEKCFLCVYYIDNLIIDLNLPSNIKNQLVQTSKYIICQYPQYFKKMHCSSQREFIKYCRANNTIYRSVLKYLSKKERCLFYIRYILYI